MDVADLFGNGFAVSNGRAFGDGFGAEMDEFSVSGGMFVSMKGLGLDRGLGSFLEMFWTEAGGGMHTVA